MTGPFLYLNYSNPIPRTGYSECYCWCFLFLQRKFLEKQLCLSYARTC